MVIFTENQRYAQRFFNGSWQEEVLSASGVAFDDADAVILAGNANVQEALDSLDNQLGGLSALPASGAVEIDEVVNVSGVTSSSIGGIETIRFTDTGDPTGGFSFTAFAQPVDPVTVKVLYAPSETASSGTAMFIMEYNIFDQGSDLTPATQFPNSITGSTALSTSDFEELKQLNFPIPTSEFALVGSAPFIVNARLKRDTSGGDTYGSDLDVLKLYADGIPGASAGTSPGYTGGNLSVTGDLTVENHLIYQQSGVAVPADSSATGISGCLAYDDNFLYICIGTNTWRRSEHQEF